MDKGKSAPGALAKNVASMELRRSSREGYDAAAFVRGASNESFQEAAIMARTNYEHRRSSAHAPGSATPSPPGSPQGSRRNSVNSADMSLKKPASSESVSSEASGGISTSPSRAAAFPKGASAPSELGSSSALSSMSPGTSSPSRLRSLSQSFKAKRASLRGSKAKQASKRLGSVPELCEVCKLKAPKARIVRPSGVKFMCKSCVSLAAANFAEFGTVSRSATGMSLYPEDDSEVIVDVLAPVCDIVGLSVKLRQTQSIAQAVLIIANAVAKRARLAALPAAASTQVRRHSLSGEQMSEYLGSGGATQASSSHSPSADNTAMDGSGSPAVKKRNSRRGSRLFRRSSTMDNVESEAAAAQAAGLAGSPPRSSSSPRSGSDDESTTEDATASLLVFDSPPAPDELVHWKLWLPPPRDEVCEPVSRRLSEFELRMLEQVVLRPCTATKLPEPLPSVEEVQGITAAACKLAEELQKSCDELGPDADGDLLHAIYVLRLAAAALESAFRESRMCLKLPESHYNLTLEQVLHFRPLWQLLKVSIQRQQSGELVGFWLLFDQMELFASRKDQSLQMEAREIARLLVNRYFATPEQINVGSTAFMSVKALEKRLCASEREAEQAGTLPDGDELLAAFRIALRDVRENMMTGFTSFSVDYGPALQDILEGRQLYAVDSLAWSYLRFARAVKKVLEVAGVDQEKGASLLSSVKSFLPENVAEL